MKGAFYSEKFDDVYFSRHDGLAETQHIFLDGNNLPEAWQNKESFSIFETGFGTGLNFFAAWDLFEKTASKNQTLDFVSVEKFPLSKLQIKEALSPWSETLRDKIDTLCNLYPLLVRGTHRIKISGQITLTLIFDDVNDALPTLSGCFNCWFLDGFTPAKNPDMWSDILFENMARLSHPKASFATFTAAGDVKRGLKKANFHVKKQKGFAYKPDMLAGHFEGQGTPIKQGLKRGSSVAIIGGGLAGTACAYTLKQYGYEPIIYEASQTLGAGASGNQCGFYNPRFCKLWDNTAKFFAPAYSQFINIAKEAGNAINFYPCGAIYLINALEKEKKFNAMIKNWRWHEKHAKILNGKETSDIAGITIDCGALYLPDAGSVNVQKLCEYYARGIKVHYNSLVTDFTQLNEDVIILCNAHSILKFHNINMLPVKKVRGQITRVAATKASKNLKCNIHFGKYISMAQNGQHHIGASFQPWDQELDLVEQDDLENINAITDNISAFSNENFEVIGAWAQYRTASHDRFPIVGRILDEKNVFASLAFGSHGLVGTIQAGHILADILREKHYCLQFETKKAIDYQRFI